MRWFQGTVGKGLSSIQAFKIKSWTNSKKNKIRLTGLFQDFCVIQTDFPSGLNCWTRISFSLICRRTFLFLRLQIQSIWTEQAGSWKPETLKSLLRFSCCMKPCMPSVFTTAGSNQKTPHCGEWPPITWWTHSLSIWGISSARNLSNTTPAGCLRVKTPLFTTRSTAACLKRISTRTWARHPRWSQKWQKRCCRMQKKTRGEKRRSPALCREWSGQT